MTMNVRRETFGSLKCLVIDALPEGTPPAFLVVLSHGFGAGGDDLADLASALMEDSQRVEQTCRFVFPAAPIDLTPFGMPGGRAWWPINMARLAEMNQTKNYEELTQLKPPGMEEAAETLTAAIREMQQKWNLDDSHLVLGGFSQGAMISTHVTLESGMQPALLTVFSGTLLNKEDWQLLAGRHMGCRVLQSHGYQDPVLPFHPAEQLRDLLIASGFQVQFEPFHGGHTIPLATLESLRAIIESL